MTYLEAIREDLAPYPIRKSLIERKCEKHGIYWSDDILSEESITLIVLEILSQMLALNNVSEGGVSLSFDSSVVKMQIKQKCNELGIDSSLYTNEAKVTYLGDL